MSKSTYNLIEIGQEFSEYTRYVGSSFSAASLGEFGDTEFYIEANVTDYDQIEVSWSSPVFELTDNLRPVETVIRWSLSGEPQTVEDGFPLVSSTDPNSLYVHTPSNGTWQGKWVYYTLFLKIASTNTSVFIDEDQYFEKMASVSALVTKDYGSIEDLWQRIPEYYRLQDSTSRHLYNYLSIYAWDLDTLRTVIDYLMVQKDPQVADSNTLQQLMEELGTIITTVELGAGRARAFMDDILNLRLSKGTAQGVIYALQAISGSLVTIDEVEKTIKVSPQRVNWTIDPKVLRGPADEWYGLFANSSDVSFRFDDVVFYGDPVAFSNASVSFSPAKTIVNRGLTPAQVFTYSKYGVPYERDDTFYFSIDEPDNQYIQEVRMYYPNGTLAASAGRELIGTVIDAVSGRSYFKLSMENAPEDSGSVHFVMRIDLPAGDFVTFKNILLEKDYIGEYFDGNTNLGGWLSGAPSRSDYRWFAEPQYSWSVFSADAWRTQSTLLNIYKKLLPVNWMDEYVLLFDQLPEAPTEPVDLIIDNFALSSLNFEGEVLVYITTELAWPNRVEI